jgi:hypothetical protein
MKEIYKLYNDEKSYIQVSLLKKAKHFDIIQVEFKNKNGKYHFAMQPREVKSLIAGLALAITTKPDDMSWPEYEYYENL